MPPDNNEIHSKLGQHEARLDAHGRELDGLWDKSDEHRAVMDSQREQMTKVRIQMALILAAGGVGVVIVQAVATKLTIEALTRLIGAK